MKKTQRPLNDNERYAALETGVAVHYLIRKIDELKQTTIYKQSLKLAANQFVKELERHAAAMVWDDLNDPAEPLTMEEKKAIKNRAAEEMEQLAEILHQNIRALLQ